MNRKKKISRHDRVVEKHTKSFAHFVEKNDWEGETWNFYIPTKDNEPAIKLLASKLKVYEDWCKSKGWDSDFKLEKEMPEFELDILVKHGNTGYMDEHNKLRGQLLLARITALPDVKDEDTANAFQSAFYKGQISEMVIEDDDE